MQISSPMPETMATMRRANASSRRSMAMSRPLTQVNDSVTGSPSTTPLHRVAAHTSTAAGATAATAKARRPSTRPAATMAVPTTR